MSKIPTLRLSTPSKARLNNKSYVIFNKYILNIFFNLSVLSFLKFLKYN